MDTIYPEADEEQYDNFLAQTSEQAANEAQLIRTIKAHITKGDKAKEKSEQAKEKSEQHYIAAGQHLKVLKAEHAGTWAEWEDLLKTKIGIGKSRASELMQIADGTKTIEQVNERRAKSMRDNRQRKISPPRGGENASTDEFGPRDEALPTRILVNDGTGRLRRASSEEEETVVAVANAIANPIINAWEKADESDRSEFVRLFKADMHDVAETSGDDGIFTETAPTLFYQACQLLERMDDHSRQNFFDGPIARIIEECAHPAEEEVLELVEEVLGGDTLSDKQAAAFEKLKKRLRRNASAAAKQTAQFKTHINEYKASLSAFAARLKAAGVARDLWLALSVRGPCGFREGIAMWLVPPLVDAIEEAIGPEAARETATCTIEPNGEVALAETAPPPDVSADNMKAQIAATDDGLDIPDILRRRAPEAT
jgi:hypothetical protein